MDGNSNWNISSKRKQRNFWRLCICVHHKNFCRKIASLNFLALNCWKMRKIPFSEMKRSMKIRLFSILLFAINKFFFNCFIMKKEWERRGKKNKTFFQLFCWLNESKSIYFQTFFLQIFLVCSLTSLLTSIKILFFNLDCCWLLKQKYEEKSL